MTHKRLGSQYILGKKIQQALFRSRYHLSAELFYNHLTFGEDYKCFNIVPCTQAVVDDLPWQFRLNPDANETFRDNVGNEHQLHEVYLTDDESLIDTTFYLMVMSDLEIQDGKGYYIKNLISLSEIGIIDKNFIKMLVKDDVIDFGTQWLRRYSGALEGVNLYSQRLYRFANTIRFKRHLLNARIRTFYNTPRAAIVNSMEVILPDHSVLDITREDESLLSTLTDHTVKESFSLTWADPENIERGLLKGESHLSGHEEEFETADDNFRKLNYKLFSRYFELPFGVDDYKGFSFVIPTHGEHAAEDFVKGKKFVGKLRLTKECGKYHLIPLADPNKDDILLDVFIDQWNELSIIVENGFSVEDLTKILTVFYRNMFVDVVIGTVGICGGGYNCTGVDVRTHFDFFTDEDVEGGNIVLTERHKPITTA